MYSCGVHRIIVYVIQIDGKHSSMPVKETTVTLNLDPEEKQRKTFTHCNEKNIPNRFTSRWCKISSEVITWSMKKTPLAINKPEVFMLPLNVFFKYNIGQLFPSVFQVLVEHFTG